jgi:Predicted Zn-dependent hydrolases of the beta-lactamase fold
MKIRWLGHSAVEILYRGKKIPIDPFVEKSEGLNLKPNLKPDLICVIHGYSDHLGSTIEIAKRANSKVVAIFELAMYLEKRGTNCVGMNIGGSINIDGIRISMVEARHSSSIIDEESGRIEYGGEPCGYIFELSKTLYHAGCSFLWNENHSRDV